MRFRVKKPQDSILDEDTGVELTEEPPHYTGSQNSFAFRILDPAWLPNQGAREIHASGDWLTAPIQIEVDGKTRTIQRIYGMSLWSRHFKRDLELHAKGGGRSADEMRAIIRGALEFYLKVVIESPNPVVVFPDT